MVLGQFECGRVWEALSSHTPASRKGLCPLSYPLNPFDQQSQAHGGDLSHQSLCTCTGDPGSFSYELWLLVNSLCPPHPLRGTYVTNFTKKKKERIHREQGHGERLYGFCPRSIRPGSALLEEKTIARHLLESLVTVPTRSRAPVEGSSAPCRHLTIPLTDVFSPGTNFGW